MQIISKVGQVSSPSCFHVREVISRVPVLRFFSRFIACVAFMEMGPLIATVSVLTNRKETYQGVEGWEACFVLVWLFGGLLRVEDGRLTGMGGERERRGMRGK